MNFREQHYTAPGYKYGTVPNRYLLGQAHWLTPGSLVLLPGDGEGRNSVWLASQGHRVHAVDSSAVGLAKAQALATRAWPMSPATSPTDALPAPTAPTAPTASLLFFK